MFVSSGIDHCIKIWENVGDCPDGEVMEVKQNKIKHKKIENMETINSARDRNNLECLIQ